ncbi:MAG: TetR/AcrR family transcriptional regulator [Caldilineaceae bacterium]
MPKVINDENVFKAVIAILVDRGYENATTKEIAEAAGFHEATLFRKYGTKASLTAKAMDAQLSTTPLSQLSYTGDLKADLCAIVQAYIDTNEQYGPVIPLLLAEAPRHPELKAALARPLANIAGIVSIIQHYQGQGLLRTEAPLMTIGVLIGPLMSRQLLQRAVNDLPPIVVNVQDYVAAFLQGRSTIASAANI